METFEILVDYSKTLKEMIIEALKKMVIVGRYDWKKDNVISEDFSTKKEVVNVKFKLICLQKRVSSEEILCYMEKDNLRQATFLELLFFGITHPEIQLKFPIVALGTSWFDSEGLRRIPYLYGNYIRRCINFNWFGYRWHKRYRFLAVCKVV